MVISQGLKVDRSCSIGLFSIGPNTYGIAQHVVPGHPGVT